MQRLSPQERQRYIQETVAIFDKYLETQAARQLDKRTSHTAFISSFHLQKIKTYIIKGENSLPDDLKSIDRIVHSSDDTLLQEIRYVRQRCLWQRMHMLYTEKFIKAEGREEYAKFLQETHAALMENYQRVFALRQQMVGSKSHMVVTSLAMLYFLREALYFFQKGLNLIAIPCTLAAMAGGIFLKAFQPKLTPIMVAEPPPPLSADLLSDNTGRPLVTVNRHPLGVVAKLGTTTAAVAGARREPIPTPPSAPPSARQQARLNISSVTFSANTLHAQARIQALQTPPPVAGASGPASSFSS